MGRMQQVYSYICLILPPARKQITAGPSLSDMSRHINKQEGKKSHEKFCFYLT